MAMPPVLAASIFGAVLGSFVFGWNTGVINNPTGNIKEFINLTLDNRGSVGDNTEHVKLIMSIVVSSFAFSGMFGGLLAGVIADKFGRIRGMIACSFVCIVGVPFFGFSVLAGSYEMVIIGRLFTGFASGLFTGLVPMYLSEVSPKEYRGAVGTLNQLGVVTGILISQVLGIDFILGSSELWPLLLSLVVIPNVLQICILPFCPESPRYLLIYRQEEELARSALLKIRQSHNVEGEMEEMQTEYDKDKLEPAIGFIGIFKNAGLRRALFVSIVLHLSQQLSGINNIFYYSATLFEQVGVSKEVSGYATMGVGAILIIMTMVSIPLMECAGRRVLHLLGLIGMLTCSIIFTVCFVLQTNVPSLKFISVTAALVFVVFFAIGPGSIPWMITPEMFSQAARPTAVAIGVGVNWTANFIVGLIFLSLLGALNQLIFIPFSVLTLIFIIYLFIEMPETKNRTFEEIAGLFQKPSPDLFGGQVQNNAFAPDDGSSRNNLVESEHTQF